MNPVNWWRRQAERNNDRASQTDGQGLDRQVVIWLLGLVLIALVLALAGL